MPKQRAMEKAALNEAKREQKEMERQESGKWSVGAKDNAKYKGCVLGIRIYILFNY